MSLPDFSTQQDQTGYLILESVHELQTVLIDEIALKMTVEFSTHWANIGAIARSGEAYRVGKCSFGKDNKVMYKVRKHDDPRKVRILLAERTWDVLPEDLMSTDYLFQCRYSKGLNHETGLPIWRVDLAEFDTAIMKAVWELIGVFGTGERG